MKKWLSILSRGLLFVFIYSLYSFASTPEGIRFIKSSTGYVIDFTLPSYQTSTVFAGGEEYLNLIVKDYGITSEAGLPSLPIISFNVCINNSEIQPEVHISRLNDSEIILANKIYPFQMPWEKNLPLSDRPFTINREYYNSTGKTDQPFVKVSEPFVIAGVKGVTVTIFPFSYNPAANKLIIINSGEIELLLNHQVNAVSGKSAVFDNYLDNIFVNYDGINENKGMNYLIITAPAFEITMQQFVDHKTSKGYNVAMFNTGITGTTTTVIKNFIQQRYDDLQTRPDYILLVGDVANIPAWVGSGDGNPTTDLKYAQLEGGDYFADAFIGRFSISSSTELQNAINKSIYMESYVGTLDKKNIFMASTDNYQISEGTHNYVIDNYFDPAGYINLKLYTHTYGATTQQLIDALNENQVFAIYSGHGSETSWADGPVLGQQQVRDLTNTWFPFVFSFACVTGSYQVSECFGETWLRTYNGASTFYGSSVNSYWDEDDILERKIIYALFEDDITRITPMFDMGKMYLVNYYGGITPTTLRYMEMYNLMGDPSMPLVLTVPPDQTPPDPVTDLSTVNPTSNSITLNWTAPYDSTFGGIATYDIRYSLTMINNDNDFNNASQKLYDGQSDTTGTPKSFCVDGLDFGSPYYFAIKAKDIFDNTSSISNVPGESTFNAPQISFSVDSMHCSVLPNSTHTDSILISNVTGYNSTLDYEIELTNNTFPDNLFAKVVGVISGQRQTKEKGNVSESHGVSIKGSGGPDLFGYEWIDSNDPNGPEYIWNDISTTGTLVTNWQPTGTFDALDEGVAGPLPLGFEFKFYDEVKTEVYVSTDGIISFDNITTDIYSNQSIPNSGSPDDFIAPLWDDLDGRTQGSVYYKLDRNKFIIQFTNWQKYAGTGSLTFQVVLQSNDRIYIYYNNLVGDLTSNTVGIENFDGSDGLQIANDASYLENNLAIQISAEPEWLFANHFSGTIYNGNSSALVLTMVTDDLELGEYSMDMVVSSNDPNIPQKTIPIRMTVTNEVPVELTSFNAVNKEGEVTLRWQTATETNNSGFQIERLKNSRTEKLNDWKTLDFIDGNGTTTEVHNYVYTDESVEHGNYLYRLKQIDFDGTVSYSTEVEVEINEPKDFALYQNYPNPFNPATTIKFALPIKTNVVISIYNSIGEKVAELFRGELETGYHEVVFNAERLSSGVYIYRIESEQFISSKKMLLIK